MIIFYQSLSCAFEFLVLCLLLKQSASGQEQDLVATGSIKGHTATYFLFPYNAAGILSPSIHSNKSDIRSPFSFGIC